MRQFLLSSCLIGLLLWMFSEQAFAKRPILFLIDAEQIYKVQDLPDTPDFLLENGTYMDLGIFYKQFRVFFIPLWNYEVQWCGYVGNADYLVRLDSSSLAEITTKASLTLPTEAKLPFWPSVGSKLLFVALLGILVGVFLGYNNRHKRKSTSKNLFIQETTPLTEQRLKP